MAKTFSYFAYGSNLLARRIHIDNPGAIRNGLGKLENYKLDFGTYTDRWKGAAATIVPSKGRYVWGAIWQMDISHLESLDRQEGVHLNIYVAFNVDVILPSGNRKNCRVYQQTATPPDLEDITDLPQERRPSPLYINTIIFGAKESGLPRDYVRYLETIPHNGYDGIINIELDLKE